MSWIEIPGYFFESEGELLQKYCVDKIVLEIGSFKGRSSVCIAEVAKELTCVDTFSASPLNPRTQKDKFGTLQIFIENIKPYKDKINIKIMNSDDFFNLLKKINIKLEFDVIFIDGLHTYEQVVKDINNSKKCLAKDGIIALHDYTLPDWPGVQKATDELLKLIEKEHTLAICKNEN